MTSELANQTLPTPFDRGFIANPDLVERFRHGWPLDEGDPSTRYAGSPAGEEGRK